MPQHITCMGKRICKRINRCIQSIFFKHIYKSEVHIQIIIQAGIIEHIFFHQAIIPNQWLVIADKCSLETEFIRAAKCNANGLPGPATFNFIFQNIFGNRNRFLRLCILHGKKKTGEHQYFFHID